MEENSLRWVLLGFGIVILMGIYAYDLWKKKRNLEQVERKREAEEKIEPVIASKGVLPPIVENEPVIEQTSSPDKESMPPINNEKERGVEEIPVAQEAMVVQLAVVAKVGAAMKGDLLKDAFTKLNLEYGDMNVFHRYQGTGDEKQQCFLVTNMLEPGTFPEGSMANFESTGLMLFFQSSDAIDSVKVFDDMLAAAKELVELFDATLIDAQMNDLTEKRTTEIRSQLKGLSGL